MVVLEAEPPRKKSIFGGIFSKSKEPRDAEKEQRERESRRTQAPGSSRPEGGGKLRSARHPAAAPVSVPGNSETLGRSNKPIPPPISIPPRFDEHFMNGHNLPKHLISSKKFRTVSIASLEAMDGTANNTTVGSPTSSRMSPTPGVMTPPLQDPYEATATWLNNEEKELEDRGAVRRRRPGVTFDLTDDDTPKSRGNYRLARASRLYARQDSE